MRRPVKPFVTEYRGSGRRGKDTGASAVLTFHAPPATGSSRSERGRATSSDENSYEAAMRAADALFAPQATRSVATPEFRSNVAGGAVGEVVQPSVASSETSAAVEPNRAGMPNGAGRVLQAIEAAVVNPVAAFEAERTSKPRGRKPGSKNKPKVESIDANVRAVRAPELLELPELSSGTFLETQSLPVFAQATIVPPLVYQRLSSRKRSERFPWVRTRLRPGEKWKRRLPKIAW